MGFRNFTPYMFANLKKLANFSSKNKHIIMAGFCKVDLMQLCIFESIKFGKFYWIVFV